MTYANRGGNWRILQCAMLLSYWPHDDSMRGEG